LPNCLLIEPPIVTMYHVTIAVGAAERDEVINCR
jgi:hypothetical protein